MAEKILVFSGKGGVGKSTVTAAISKSLSSAGKRVLCIDADAGFKSLDLMLGVGNAVYNWLDVINKRCDCAGATAFSEGLPDFLSAPSGLDDGFNSENLKELFEQLDGSYDYIFIDSPAGWGELHEIFSDVCDRALLVTTADNICVRSAETAASKLRKRNPLIDIKLIINRFDKSQAIRGGQLKLDDVVDGVREGLTGVVPEDRTMGKMPEGDMLSFKAQAVFDRISKRITGQDVVFNPKAL